MSIALIIGITIAYACVAILECAHMRYGTGLVFGGYAIANIGLIWGMAQ